jgi:hypothetical protein
MQAPVTIGVCGETVFDAAREGVLTDAHAACSYGQPVVVIDGVPHGPGDLGGELLSLHYGLSLVPDGRDPALYESDAEIAARRNPEWVALAERAKAAGFRVA